MVTVVEMRIMRHVQILDEAICILRSTNNLAKGINPIILHSAIGYLILVWLLNKEK